MNGPVLDPDKEESTMEALGMIETRGLVALIEASDARGESCARQAGWC